MSPLPSFATDDLCQMFDLGCEGALAGTGHLPGKGPEGLLQ
jgi:hypothetical protein